MPSPKRFIVVLSFGLSLLGTGAAFAQNVAVTTGANIRIGPTTASAIIATVEVGTILHVIGTEGEWSKVEVFQKDGTKKIGYIATRLVVAIPLKKTADAVEPKPVPALAEPDIPTM